MASSSYLSKPAHYGYDYVVATTQASINSSLKSYLLNSDQPVMYLCFCVPQGSKVANPAEQIDLATLLLRTNNVNPFDFPPDIDPEDPRIAAVTKARFLVGVKMQVGLPNGIAPINLPDIVTLGKFANNVSFNLFCSELVVIENSLGNSMMPGSWNIYEPTRTQPWYLQMGVDLVVADLDKSLDTPYFNSNPEEKAALLAQLQNLSGSAFSLQQLYFDLDNALVETQPTFQGLPSGSLAKLKLEQCFRDVYGSTARERGLPLVQVTVVAQDIDPSPLLLTGYGTENPFPFHLKHDSCRSSVTTLDFLCAANHHVLPVPMIFNWNWVQPQDIDTESGVIAINRQTIGQYFMDQLLPAVKQSCMSSTSWVHVDAGFGISTKCQLFPGQTPQTSTISAAGPEVVHIEYNHESHDSSYAGASYGNLIITNKYTCDVSFVRTAITIKQHLLVTVHIHHDLTSNTAPVIDKQITDTYTIAVGDSGHLRMTKGTPVAVDSSSGSDIGAFLNFFTGVDTLINKIKGYTDQIVGTQVKEIPLNDLQNFIFPGGKVFTYKSASFSDYQPDMTIGLPVNYTNFASRDLTCAISYVDPTTAAALAPPPAPPAHFSMRAMHSMATPLADSAPHTARSVMQISSTEIAPDVSESGLKLTYSSDLMLNYVQGEIVSPAGKFEALQTSNGHALLFSVDTSSVFHVIEEQSDGATRTGWVLSDLSTTAIQTVFPGKTDAVVRNFDVGQSAVDGTIGMAIAVSSGGSDRLLVSLSNSNTDLAWIQKPVWTSYRFDAVAQAPPSSLSIVGILFTETLDNTQYLVVDIDRPTESSSSIKHIERYHIDPTKATGRWVKADVSVDIEDGAYQSCVGRKPRNFVDGIYTSGILAGGAQLVYTPIVNMNGSGPPLTVRLSPPNGAVPSAIATSRDIRGDDSNNLFGTTDLYTISGTTLYRFAAGTQADGAIGVPLVTNDFLGGTETLSSMTHDGVTTLWGKNASDEVYYLSCPTAQLSVPGSWSAPVPILTGVEHMSPYINKLDGGNTIFASGAGKLQKISQSTDTASKLWKVQEIKLAASPQEKALSFNSYTTTVHVADAGDLPARGVELEISTISRTPVYIQGLYYALGKTPVVVKTDTMGSLTVVEATEDIHGATITISADKGVTKTVINPTEKSFQKLAALDSEDALRGATRAAGTVAGGIVAASTSVPLVASNTPGKDVTAVAANLGNLQEAYSSFEASPAAPGTDVQVHSVVPVTRYLASRSLSSLGHDIAVAAGDIFRWLKSGVQAAIKFIKDAASGVWHFFTTIAGKIYRAALDTAEAVVGALEWVFDAIKTGIEEIIHFVEFLFEWDDITRTKDVMHNVVKLYMQDKVSDLGIAKQAFDQQVGAVEQSLNHWAGITDWSPLGDPAGKPATNSTSNPAKGQTSGSQLFSSAFKNHASDLSITGGEPTFDVVQKLADDLLTAISNEAAVLEAVYDKFKDLAHNFHSLSVADILKQIAIILVDGVLSSAQVVVDALLDILRDLATSAIDLLDAKLHIPIISDILNALGIPDISFLDLFTWIGAVGYTVVYKIVEGEAPFPDNGHVKAIISATDWDSLATVFADQPVSRRKMATRTLGIDLSSDAKKMIFVGGHAIAGFMVLMGDFLSVLEAEGESGGSPFSIPSAIMALISAAAGGAADFLSPKSPIENTAVSIISDATLVAVIVSKLAFCGPVQNKLGASSSKFSKLAVNDGRATGAIVDSILVIPALFVTGWHLYELSGKAEGAERSAAIVGEVSNLASYVSRISYAVAVNDKEPLSKQVVIGILAVSNVVVAGLQTAEAAIH
ncbi:hypothetical protein LSUE1_G006517 [Lachnellula suecica]|uniref:Uncharacterized protein n=1 Tax=Lachnellula suecica TaxID=602035 RepID=A0A8T9CB15_9HELO|nr:hypothetical protein LSUE1_G006517 [Lachnellula suecica]